MAREAKLEIRIKAPKGQTLPEDLPAAFELYVEHVQSLLAQGYVAGQICDERFSGWWEIK